MADQSQQPQSKSIFASKTFWVNVLMGAAAYGGFLPPKYAAVVVPVANVALRIVTNQPVSVLPSGQGQE